MGWHKSRNRVHLFLYSGTQAAQVETVGQLRALLPNQKKRKNTQCESSIKHPSNQYTVKLYLKVEASGIILYKALVFRRLNNKILLRH